MARRDVDEYYAQVSKQYNDIIKELEEFEIEAQRGMFPPERLDEIKKSLAPLMINYQRITYIMYLLNKPNRKSKISDYEKRNKKLYKQISHSNTLKGVIEENDSTKAELAQLTKAGD